MKKKIVLIPTLSSLLVCTTILANHAYADENVETASQPATSQLVATPSQSDPSLVTEAVSEVAPANLDSPERSVTEPANPVTTDVSQASVSSQVASTERAASTSQAPNANANPALTIIHTNDVHGRIEESKGVIGDAKLATLIKEERAKGETIVLDAGDAFQGMPISNSTKGEDMAAIMNKIGFDAMAVGNHEFDFGLDQVRKYKKLLTFPLLSANTYVNDARLFQESTVIDKDTTRLGDEVVVIGVTTPETATKTHPNNIVGVRFADPVSEVNRVIAEVEARALTEGKNYPTYVILAHLGIDPTTPVAWQGSTLAKALSQNPQLAGKRVVVLDGHSHTVQTTTYGTNVTYNQTGSYLNNVGKITLTADKVLAEIIPADQAQKLEADPTIAAMVAKIKAKYDAENAQVVIANNPVELNGDRSNVRVRETNLGNVVADALWQYGQTGFSHPTDIAVTNGGGLRASIAKDKPVTKGDIIAVLPFGNIISQIQVTGQAIQDMFTKALGSITQVDQATGQPILDANGRPLLEANGGFLHISGARVYYDTMLPPEKRILAITIWDKSSETYQPLDLNRTYYLATNDFVAAGGDGYTMLGGAREEGPSMDAVFAEYLKQANLADYAEINPSSRLLSVDHQVKPEEDKPSDTSKQTKPDPMIPDASNPQPTKKSQLTTAPGHSMTRPSQSISQQSPRLTVAVHYKTSRSLPKTNAKESLLAILLGFSLTGAGLYGTRRRS